MSIDLLRLQSIEIISYFIILSYSNIAFATVQKLYEHNFSCYIMSPDIRNTKQNLLKDFYSNCGKFSYEVMNTHKLK